MLAIYFWAIPIIILVAGGIHMGVSKQPRKKGRRAEIWLSELLFWLLGVTNLLFVWLWAFPPFAEGAQVTSGLNAMSADGQPFILGAAFLGMGIVGILSPWFRGGYWIASVVLSLVFGFGALATMIVFYTSWQWLTLAIVYWGVGPLLQALLLCRFWQNASEDHFWTHCCCHSLCKLTGKKGKGRQPRKR